MRQVVYFILMISIGFSFVECKQQSKPETPKKSAFDTTINGKSIRLYTLKNANGLEVKITNYGARIVSLVTPDKNGNFEDIVLGYNSIEDYLNDNMYMGCIVGRYANRIDTGTFTLEGKTYNIPTNDGENMLHGGKVGFDQRIWDAEKQGNTVRMTYISPHMEQGFPGKLTTHVSYTLTDTNTLQIKYKATTTKPTVVNLSNHSYFNLDGSGDTTILDHIMTINANYFTPVDSTFIPTGEFKSVEGTPFDFRKGVAIGKRINNDNTQLKYAKGYDHNWVLQKDSNELSLSVKVYEPNSGRVMKIFTTEPGQQFYSGNFMDGSVIGKYGNPYVYRLGLVLEPQHFPDSPNHPNFPSTILNPGETYTHTDVYEFSVKNKK